ncbi:competence/damage-inducible protein A [Egibacter rhizosphaerae]|uniref:Competence/damage-inducible protein A n=1 Tax=Egibacter rhizosphaerae TaxID=1670831 RepID=A0A411YCM2_9ACTN|nr:molybdopterin-binding protein [Egibacter rhizosphaerae]QBI18912.1 competence/damage-inducible protein A [Egibacter rhizosphaerae]
MSNRASIVVIGDEILDGHTRDTNSGWLARRLSDHGIAVDRIVTVPDEDSAIHEALGHELARPRPRLVLTSGGIGSTPDDRTMAAVATYLDVDLVAHPDLDARLTGWARQSVEDDAPIPDDQFEAMRKMALVPDGAYLLPGMRGITPGVGIDLDGGSRSPQGATVIVLPGVPREFERIVDEGVEPLLAEIGQSVHVRELTHPYPESALSPLLGELTRDHPAVAVGSYPGKECVVRLKGPPEEVARVEARVRERLATLESDPVAARQSARWQARWE